MPTKEHRDLGVDAIKLNRALMISLGFILAVVASGFVMTTGNIIFMSAFVAIPFVLMLMYRPDIAFVMAFLMDATGFDIPGVSYTTLGLLAKVIIVATSLLAFWLISHEAKTKKIPESRSLKCFVGLIIVLMAARGAGLRMLGSSTWGGMIYVVLLAGIAFFFAVQKVRISRKQIRWVIFGMALCGLLGSITSAFGWEAASVTATEAAQSRLRWLQPFVMAAFPLVFAVPLRRLVKAVLWVALLGVMGLTGFRSLLVALIMMSFIYGFFRARSTIRYALTTGLVGVFLWLLIIFASPSFPPGLQRAVSFVPGATVDATVLRSAEGSVEWRVEIWKYCLQQSDKYLLLGRGSAFNALDTAAGLGVKDVQTYSPWFAYETRSYHSGPLSLLIDYGIPGLLIASWFMVVLFRRFWGYANKLGTLDTMEARFALYWCAYMLWNIAAFYLVYGSMVNLANRIIGPAALAIVLYNSVDDIDGAANLESECAELDDLLSIDENSGIASKASALSVT